MVGKGKTLKRLRREMGMKQRDLALISGVAQTTISKIECGMVTPYRRTLWKLAHGLDTFGCEGAAELIDGDWRPLRGKMSIFVRLTLHIVARM